MRRVVTVLAVAAGVVLAAPSVASAHPLGNFTVNHYLGVTLTADEVDVLAVVDTAEIPTAQARASIDTDHDGQLDPAEAQAQASRGCAQALANTTVELAGSRLALSVVSASFGYRPGAANLPTGRLECRLRATARVDRATTLVVRDGTPADRIGWHEITARGDGVRLQDSPVPASSVSEELRRYPNDLLSSPLDVREASIKVLPGAGSSTYGTFTTAPRAGFLGRTVGALDREFGNLVGRRDATPVSLALAALLALLLGAAHAALPGHGKTIMAAYLAGRRGSTRDALVVGATVTITHTVGVLALGLALSLSSSLAGEVVTRRLALVSGLIVVGVGIGLLRSALRGGHGHSHGPGGHSHGPGGHEHEHDHGHDHHAHDDHDHHDHDHAHDNEHDGEPSLALAAQPARRVGLLERVEPAPTVERTPRRFGRAGLVGMGVAGGLVPSPSALVVLLSAIALGRPWLGIGLVVLYGVGMAGTLTALGLLLVRAGGRLQSRLAAPGPRVARALSLLPVGTASAVIAVGALLSWRAL